MREQTLTVEVAYKQYRGLLFSALAKLAKQGFAVVPEDGADLVHDFFAEAWNGIAERYEPERAATGTYVYTAFVRFARPRIVRLRRFRSSLVEPKDLERLAGDPESDVSEPADLLDLERLHRAIVALRSPDRELLEYWLNIPSGSERELARSFGLSRYQARLQLIDALGQLSVAVGALSSLNSRDGDVAIAVWRDGLSIDETSAKLDMTAKQVCNAYRRNRRLIERTLFLIRAPHVHGRIKTMPQTTAEGLIKRIYTEHYNAELIQHIKSHAAEVLEHLRRTEDESLIGLPDEWLSGIYAAIAAGLGAEFEPEIDEALFKADTKDRDSVGHAFFEVLVPTGRIARLIKRCNEKLVRAPIEVQKLLESESDVRAGRQPALELATFGLTPTHLVLATDAIGLLLERAIDAGFFTVESSIFLRPFTSDSLAVTSEGCKDGLIESELIEEISKFAEVNKNTSEVLLRWAVETVEVVPYLFVGFRFVGFRPMSGGNALELKQLKSSETPANLFERWNAIPRHSQP